VGLSGDGPRAEDLMEADLATGDLTGVDLPRAGPMAAHPVGQWQGHAARSAGYLSEAADLVSLRSLRQAAESSIRRPIDRVAAWQRTVAAFHHAVR
jgi:hypothetical protein